MGGDKQGGGQMIPPIGPERDKMIETFKLELDGLEVRQSARTDSLDIRLDGEWELYGKPKPYHLDTTLCMGLAEELAENNCVITQQINMKREAFAVGVVQNVQIKATAENTDLAAAFCDAVTEAWLKVIGGIK
jgi:hypothetical protein